MPVRRKQSLRRTAEPLAPGVALAFASLLDHPGPGGIAVNLGSERVLIPTALRLFEQDRRSVLGWWVGFVRNAVRPLAPWQHLSETEREHRARLRALTLPWVAVHVDFGGRQPKTRAAVERYLAAFGLTLPAAEKAAGQPGTGSEGAA